jgi:hypothetical protein
VSVSSNSLSIPGMPEQIAPDEAVRVLHELHTAWPDRVPGNG